MHRLTAQEILDLEHLTQSKSDFFKMPAIVTLVYLFGGILGWLSILLFLAFFGFELIEMGLLGVLLMSLALYWHKVQKFSPLLILSMMILGHIHLLLALSEGMHLHLTAIFFIELIMTVGAYYFFNPPLYRLLQMFLMVGIIFALPFEYHAPLAAFILLNLSVIVLIFLWLRPHIKFLFMREVLMITQTVYVFVLFNAGSFYHSFHAKDFDFSLAQGATAVIFTLLFAATLFKLYPILRKNRFAIAALFALALIGLYASFGIVLTLLFLLLSTYTQEKRLRVLSLLLLTLFLFYFYYSLLLPLDQKGVMLMATGLVCFASAWFLRKNIGDSNV